MRVVCDKCGTRYKITIKKTKGKAVTFKCGKCQNLIRIKPDQMDSENGGAPEKEDATKTSEKGKAGTQKATCLKCGNSFIKPASDKNNVCFQCRIDALVGKVKDKYGVEAQEPEPEEKASRYTIRSADGLVLGPIKLHTVAVLAREKRIKGVEEVSKDDSEYMPLMEYPELAEMFPGLQEVMDTSGLDDKLDEAFMSAFGGEELEEDEQEADQASPDEETVPDMTKLADQIETSDEAEPAEEGEPEEEKEPEPEEEPEPEPEKDAEEGAVEIDVDIEESEPEPPEPEPDEGEEPEQPEAEEPAEAGADEDDDEVIDWGGSEATAKKADEPPESEEEEPEEHEIEDHDQFELVDEKAEPEPSEEPEPAAQPVPEEDIGTEFDPDQELDSDQDEEEEEGEEEEILEDLEPLSEPPPDANYRIRYPDGLMLGPVKLATVKELFESGNLTGQEDVQREGEPWAGFAELPELAELVVEEAEIGEDDVVELTEVLEEHD